MNQLLVNSYQSVKKLRYSKRSYTHITIDISKIENGLLNTCVHWALFRLELDGDLIFVGVELKGYGFGINNLRMWQIISLVKAVYGSELKPRVQKNKVIFTTTKTDKFENGVTLGIVASNDAAEIESLKIQLTNISKQIEGILYPVEIIVCMSCKDESYQIIVDFGETLHLNIRVIIHDCYRDETVYIAEKKSKIWLASTYSKLIVCHTRILFTNNFFAKIDKVAIAFSTPNVKLLDGLPYLDLIFKRNLKLTSVGKSMPKLASRIGNDYLKLLNSDYECYIDGGIFVFNTALFNFNPFEIVSDIPWGRGEDVSMANIIRAKNIPIDYLPELNCISNRSKFKVRAGIIKTLSELKLAFRYSLLRLFN